jgi:hypothetical protein
VALSRKINNLDATLETKHAPRVHKNAQFGAIGGNGGGIFRADLDGEDGPFAVEFLAGAVEADAAGFQLGLDAGPEAEELDFPALRRHGGQRSGFQGGKKRSAMLMHSCRGRKRSTSTPIAIPRVTATSAISCEWERLNCRSGSAGR